VRGPGSRPSEARTSVHASQYPLHASTTSLVGTRVVVVADDVAVLVEGDVVLEDVDVTDDWDDGLVDDPPEPVEVQAPRTSSAANATPPRDSSRI
jgi:hypothetical protein